MKTFLIVVMLFFGVFEMRANEIKLNCWIVNAKEGDHCRTETDIEDMVDEVNNIYSQACMSFRIDSISITNDVYLSVIDYTNAVQRAAVVNIANNTNGIEVYFVSELKGSAVAYTLSQGIVVGPNGNFRTLSHEIGHACGVRDIYDQYTNVTSRVSGYPTKARLPLDWGWYPEEMTQVKLIKKLLMYGYRNDIKADISSGNVHGLFYTSGSGSIRNWQLGLAPVGFSGANRNPRSN